MSDDARAKEIARQHRILKRGCEWRELAKVIDETPPRENALAKAMQDEEDMAAASMVRMLAMFDEDVARAYAKGLGVDWSERRNYQRRTALTSGRWHAEKMIPPDTVRNARGAYAVELVRQLKVGER